LQFNSARFALIQSISAAAIVLANGPATAADLNVTATIKPIHALVAEVMQGVGTPKLLVTGASSPHTYALKPSDAKALYASDVVFRVSEAVEPFTAKIVKALPDHVRVITLADAPGVEQLDARTGNTFEPHAHEGHDDDHDDGHEHGSAADHHDEGAEKHGHDAHEHDHDTHGARDGHVWLDPANARKMLAEIARVLSEASPENAAKFAENATRASAGIGALEARIARELEPVRGKPFVVFHDAYQYFEHRFGLDAVGSITVSPEVQPSAKRLTEIRRKITALDAKCVFAEPRFQPNLISAVIEGTNAHPGTLDPEGTMIDPGPGAYVTLIENLADSLRSCLAEGS
jgi:zinc transport system substrate-binding protein